jgi:uncharacterized protein
MQRVLLYMLAIVFVGGFAAVAGQMLQRKPVRVEAASRILPAGPRSGLIAVTMDPAYGPEHAAQAVDTANLAAYVRSRVAQVAAGELPSGVEFPLAAEVSDKVRVIGGLQANLVVAWFDPLTPRASAAAPRFGANTDYVVYLGEGWEKAKSPYFQGSDEAGYVFASHEYISGKPPTQASAPAGHMAMFAEFLSLNGLLNYPSGTAAWPVASVNRFIEEARREVGGSYFRVTQDPETREWSLDRRGAKNQRYDATGDTRFRMTGPYAKKLLAEDPADDIVSGTLANCSGGITPWGTVITSEENTQYFYGDVEPLWTPGSQLRAGVGFDPGAPIDLPTQADPTSLLGRHSLDGPELRRDLYGWQAEIDVGEPAGDYLGRSKRNRGHAKHTALGRARWENISFVTVKDEDGIIRPEDDKPLVAYFGNDRYNGRVYKFVSKGIYRRHMSRADKRALLHEGRVYVSHLRGVENTAPGGGYHLSATGRAPAREDNAWGRWIELSLTSMDVPPNAARFNTDATVGQALKDMSWNGIGGFRSLADVRAATYTAAAKIGVFEQNRPEDVEWNWVDRLVYIAYTGHTGRPALNPEGVVTAGQANRDDGVGRIWVFQESDPANPHNSSTFQFWEVWAGSQSQTDTHAATNPDNLMIDSDGGVWFGTDGNFQANEKLSDALYYLDQNPAHRDSPVPTYGKAFRIVGVPSDSEATGPALTARMGSLFLSVQHPGDRADSEWPANQFPGL